MKKYLIYLCAALVAMLTWSQIVTAKTPAVTFPVTQLKAGNQTIYAEVASTEQQREHGLMNRKHLPKNHGMLFTFGAPAKVCMWMKNTPIDLSVAFLDQYGNIINIEEMRANTTTSHCGAGPVYFALEMNAHWFDRHGLKPGSNISIPE